MVEQEVIPIEDSSSEEVFRGTPNKAASNQESDNGSFSFERAMNFGDVPKRGSQLHSRLREKTSTVASSTPMTNQPALVLMILPSTPPKSLVNIRVTRRCYSSAVDGSRSPIGTWGGDEGDDRRKTSVCWSCRDGGIFSLSSREPYFDWVREDVFKFPSSMTLLFMN